MLRPRKVAFISHSYLESAYRGKLRYLAQTTDLRLITPSSYPSPYGWYELDFEFNTGVNVQSYPIQFLHLQRTATRWLLRSRDLGFSRFQPDIIHVEMEPHGWITCQALLYRKMFAPQARVVIFSWENLTLQEQGYKARALEQLARFNRRLVDYFICGNIAGKEILLSKGISTDRTTVLPQSGIDPDIFYPYTPERRESFRHGSGIAPSEFAVGFVGQFVKRKGLLDLVEAMSKLRTTSQRAMVLVLAGRGELEQVIKQRCAQLNLKLIVLPAQKYNRVPEIMNLLDVLVLPSQSRPIWKEQFGRVLIEAMACGTPVIGSDSGEIPNVIGGAGLVFRECDYEHLSDCLRLCCENEGLRLALRKRGLERVLSYFTNQRIAEQTLQIYDRISSLDNRRDRARRDVSLAPMSGV